jgi:hypothetical protein
MHVNDSFAREKMMQESYLLAELLSNKKTD